MKKLAIVKLRVLQKLLFVAGVILDIFEPFSSPKEKKI
jgi:hypothetical protein|nr:MAG TPA: hypothetical protein [Caudoviricetes sp.]